MEHVIRWQFFVKLESMQIKAALFVLNDILTELSDLSRTFQKSDITPMETQAVAQQDCQVPGAILG